MTGLTRAQSSALDFIVAYMDKTGIAPSYREITDALGLASLSSAKRLVDRLIERGHLSRLDGQARSLVLIKRPTGSAPPYSVEAITALSPEAFADLEAVVSTVARCRLRDRALAREIGDGAP